MSKHRSQVKNELKGWYDWLVSYVPKPIRGGVSRALKAFKDKIMGLYKSIKEPERRNELEESFNPIERDQAFSRAYRSYRINGRPRMDVDSFFD